MSQPENSKPFDIRDLEPEAPPADPAQAASSPAAPPSPEVAAAPPVDVSQLQADLEAARNRVNELARAFQALNQDREEFKQRLTRERERLIDVEKGSVAQALLEAVDQLDLCLQASAEDSSALAKGVRLIRDNLLARVTAMGIERMNLAGTTYDPNVAEAVDMEMTAERSEDQKVTEEIRAGYRFKGKVIRPARVKVAKFVQPAQA